MDTKDQNNINQVPQNVGKIDDSILNTPAQPPSPINKQLPGRTKETETYLQMNKPNVKNQPNSDVMLDLDGKKLNIEGQSQNEDNNLRYLEKVLGINTESGSNIASNTFLIFSAVFIGLFIFLIINLKKSDHIIKLEREIENLKKR